MHRRAFLALSGTALSLGLAGCRGGGSTTETPTGTDGSTTATPDASTWQVDIPDSPPDVDCEAAARPMPTALDREDALRPRDYPGRPPEPLTVAAAVDYVTAFERAYRQNDEMVTSNEVGTATEREEYLTRFNITVRETWAATDGGGSAVVRLRYNGSGTTHPGTEFDYVTQYVTYYVDQSLVVRARTTQYGFGGVDELSPDPWADGSPLACFDS